MKPEYSLLASLFISETSHSNAKFGEDKATTAELHNAAAARGILEGFLAVFRGFSRQWTSPPYGRPSFSSIFPFLPFFSFFFFISHGWRTFDFIFARGYMRDHIFRPPISFSLLLSLSFANTTHTRHLYNQRRVRMHYDKREDESAASGSDRSREHCVGGGVEEVVEEEEEEEERNLFLRPQRRRLVSSWPYLLLILLGRTSDREGGIQKVRIKTRSTGVNVGTRMRILCADAWRRTAGPFDIRHESVSSDSNKSMRV